MEKEGSPEVWRASSLKGVSLSSVGMKSQDAFKFNDMVQYNGNEVGSVMGLVSRFENSRQADQAIQYHQAGLGGLGYEKRLEWIKIYDDITGSPGKRRRVASSTLRKGVGGGEVQQGPGGSALTRSRPSGGPATTAWTWPPAPSALTGRVLGGDDGQPVPGGPGVSPSCLSAQGAPRSPPACTASTGGPPAPPAPPISGLTTSVRLLADLWEQGPPGPGGKTRGRSTWSSRGGSRASRTPGRTLASTASPRRPCKSRGSRAGPTPSSKTPTRASRGPEQWVHHGAVHSRYHRVPGLPDHYRELPEGGEGHEVTADPPDCVHHLEGIRKFSNILPEGKRTPFHEPETGLQSRRKPSLKILRIRKRLKGR